FKYNYAINYIIRNFELTVDDYVTISEKFVSKIENEINIYYPDAHYENSYQRLQHMFNISISPFWCHFEPYVYNKTNINDALYAYEFFYIMYQKKILLISPKEKNILVSYMSRTKQDSEGKEYDKY